MDEQQITCIASDVLVLLLPWRSASTQVLSAREGELSADPHSVPKLCQTALEYTGYHRSYSLANGGLRAARDNMLQPLLATDTWPRLHPAV